MAVSFEKILDEIPITIAHFMNGRIRKRWEEGLKGDPRIPAIKPESRARRRRPASRGKDTILFDEGDLLRATQTLDLGDRKAAVTNTDRKAVPHFFGVPAKKLPARDIFKVVIEDEIAADSDMKIINKMLDEFEREWERRS